MDKQELDHEKIERIAKLLEISINEVKEGIFTTLKLEEELKICEEKLETCKELKDFIHLLEICPQVFTRKLFLRYVEIYHEEDKKKYYQENFCICPWEHKPQFLMDLYRTKEL